MLGQTLGLRRPFRHKEKERFHCHWMLYCRHSATMETQIWTWARTANTTTSTILYPIHPQRQACHQHPTVRIQGRPLDFTTPCRALHPIRLHCARLLHNPKPRPCHQRQSNTFRTGRQMSVHRMALADLHFLRVTNFSHQQLPQTAIVSPGEHPVHRLFRVNGITILKVIQVPTI